MLIILPGLHREHKQQNHLSSRWWLQHQLSCLVIYKSSCLVLTEAPTQIHKYHELTVSLLSLLHGLIRKILCSIWFLHCHQGNEFPVAHDHVSLQTEFLKQTHPEAFSDHEECHKSWVIQLEKNIVHSCTGMDQKLPGMTFSFVPGQR